MCCIPCETFNLFVARIQPPLSFSVCDCGMSVCVRQPPTVSVTMMKRL